MLLQAIYWSLGLSQSVRLCLVVAYCTVTALYLHNVAKRWPPGCLQCTMACLPVLLANLLVPWLFDRSAELIFFVCTCFIFVWLSEFKVIGEPPL